MTRWNDRELLKCTRWIVSTRTRENDNPPQIEQQIELETKQETQAETKRETRRQMVTLVLCNAPITWLKANILHGFTPDSQEVFGRPNMTAEDYMQIPRPRDIFVFTE